MLDLLAIAGLAALFAKTDAKTPKKRRCGERLVGGKGDGRKPSEFDAREFKKGVRHEMEHTRSKAVAREIASDHLVEHPDYYSQLEKAERQMKKA